MRTPQRFVMLFQTTNNEVSQVCFMLFGCFHVASSHTTIWGQRLMSVAMLREAHAGHQKRFNISEKQHGDFLNVSVGEVKIWGSLHTAGKVKLTRKTSQFFSERVLIELNLLLWLRKVWILESPKTGIKINYDWHRCPAGFCPLSYYVLLKIVL